MTPPVIPVIPDNDGVSHDTPSNHPARPVADSSIAEPPPLPRENSQASAFPPPFPWLPVIRNGRRERRSFHLDRYPEGVALYEDALVLFLAPRKSPLPLRAFAATKSDSIAGIPKFKIKRKIAWEEIESLRADRKGTNVLFKGVGGKKKFAFEVPLIDARWVVQGCALFLGDRFHSTLVQADFEVRPARSRAFLYLAALVFLVSSGLIAWMTPKALSQTGDPYGTGVEIAAFAGLVPLALPAALLSGFYLFGKWLDRPTRRPAGVEPFRSVPLGLLLRISGLLFFVLGYAFPEQVLLWVGAPASLSNFSLLQVTSILTMFPGGLLLYLGYRLSARRGSQSLADDSRRPTLYLRSFGDDGRNNLNPDGFAAKALGLRPFGLLAKFGPIAHLYPLRMLKLLLGIAADTAEEQLGSFFRRLGPFVAIGKPGEAMATTGADRLYVAHDQWQERVLDLMDRSQAVVLQPAATEGVWWEIGKTIDRVNPNRLLLCLANFETAPQAYDDFRHRFGTLTGRVLPPTTEGAHFLRFDHDWTPHLLPSIHRSPLVWPLHGLGLDLQRTLQPFFELLPDTAVPLSGKKSANYLPGWILSATALILWNVVPAVALYKAKLFQGQRRQYSAAFEGARTEIHNEKPGYRWHLWEAWQEQPNSGTVPARVFFSERQLLAAVITASAYQGNDSDLDGMLQEQLSIIDNSSAEAPTEVSRRLTDHQNHRWLEVEIRAHLFSEADQRMDQLDESFDSTMRSFDSSHGLSPKGSPLPAKRRDRLTADQLAKRKKDAVETTFFLAFSAGPEGRFAVKLITDTPAVQRSLVRRENIQRLLADFEILPLPAGNFGNLPAASTPSFIASGNTPKTDSDAEAALAAAAKERTEAEQAATKAAEMEAEALAMLQQADRSLGLYWSGMPEKAMSVVRKALENGETIISVAIQPGGGYVVVGNSHIFWDGISDDLTATMKGKLKDDIRQVAFNGPDQWAFTFGTNGYCCSRAPEGLPEALKEINGKGE